MTEFERLKRLFPEAIQGRKGPMLAERYVHKIVDGIAVNFTRRRYGDRTYCWAEIFSRGQWVSLGDPWPAVTPSHAELASAILQLKR